VRSNRDYYDEFSSWYERERGRGYHDLLDELESDAVARYGCGQRVLEAGCGTGLVLDRLRGFAGQVTGVDLSPGMLARARERALPVAQADVCRLPFPDASFDVVCSFKVLAHVAAIETAVHELARVTRPGGHLVLEFYNRHSLRYVIKRLKRPSKISDSETDAAVYTRYDSLADVRGYLPPGVDLVEVRGVRVVTPVSHVFRLAPLAALFRALERGASEAPLLRRLGGFMVVVARKNGAGAA
jgi:ubiquinone/menaquinone biosynthesis C-methylase UbiE